MLSKDRKPENRTPSGHLIDKKSQVKFLFGLRVMWVYVTATKNVTTTYKKQKCYL
jgi:hypothetical protein